VLGRYKQGGVPGRVRPVAESTRQAVGISPNRLAEIINNRRRITADTALRLSLYFGNSAEFWMNLQTHYDLKMARRNLKPEDARRIKAQRAA
jgi:addiction module HigA family antidote